MGSIFLELRDDYVNKRGECAIRLVIMTSKGSPPRTNTGYAVNPKYWDARNQQIKGHHPNAQEWNIALQEKLTAARRQYAIADASGKSTRGKKIAQAVKIGGVFKDVANWVAAEHDKAGRHGTARKIESVANIVEKYDAGVHCSDIDTDWLESFGNWLKPRKHNTIVSKKVAVSAILNRAALAGIITTNMVKDAPKGSYVESDKDWLEMDEIKKVWELSPKYHWLAAARATFLFSFFASGMRMKDVLLLPKSAIQLHRGKARLRWIANKTLHSTGRMEDVPMNGYLTTIIKEWKNDSGTVFGLIGDSFIAQGGKELAKEIKKVETMIGKEMWKLAAAIKSHKHITFHSARHSFINLASRASKRDLKLVRDSVGHTKLATTDIYLDRDQVAIDGLLKKVYGG